MAQTTDIAAARRFLVTGKPVGLSDPDLAKACDQLVQEAAQKSFSKALVVAQNFVSASEGFSPTVRAAAFRSLARTTHQSGKHREALEFYLKARGLLNKDPLSRSRIDRALIDVYMYLGEFAKAKRSAQSAMKAFARLSSENDLAQTKVNFANILHRQDRHRQAEQLYREAAKFFTEAGNQVAAARTNYNWANTLVQLFEFKQAEQLYKEAEKTYQSAGFDLDACDAHYGLAWLEMLRGDFHVALRDLSSCEETYRKGGDPRGEALCALDRSEIYIYLGLYNDALHAARHSERRFRRLKLRYESAKAMLFIGQAAAALDLRREARDAVKRAQQAFADEKNTAFLGICAMLEADLSRSEREQRRFLRNARKAFDRAELPLWQAVCDLRPFSIDTKGSMERLSRNNAVRIVPHLFALWQTALGDRAFANGRRASARDHWQRAADRIDGVRAQLPPFGLRRSYGAARNLPHRRLIDFELARRPIVAAAWSERNKTAGIWSPLTTLGNENVRKRVEESLEKLSSQVAALSYQGSGGTGARGAGDTRVKRHAEHLKKQIREGMSELEHMAGSAVASEDWLSGRIGALSRKRPILQFHLGDADIVAFVHERQRTRLVTYRDGRKKLTSLLGRMRFFVEGELLPAYPSPQSRLEAERAMWAEFGDWLWKPLNLGDGQQVLIIPEGELANIPWQAILVDGQPLGDHFDFLLSPSIRHYLRAESRTPDSSTIRVFRGASENLPSVDEEIGALRELFGENLNLYHPCHRRDWPDVDSAAVWHFTGHAQMNSENPFYSCLLLADGPLFAADFRLKQCNVGLVTLAACRSGEQTVVPGEESTGLVRSLLEMGARTVIAPHWPVADGPAALWMSTFYTGYIVYDDALAAARYAGQTVRASFPSACHWAAFSVFGACNPGGFNAQ